MAKTNTAVVTNVEELGFFAQIWSPFKAILRATNRGANALDNYAAIAENQSRIHLDKARMKHLRDLEKLQALPEYEHLPQLQLPHTPPAQ